jgi:hypothetical protein
VDTPPSLARCRSPPSPSQPPRRQRRELAAGRRRGIENVEERHRCVIRLGCRWECDFFEKRHTDRRPFHGRLTGNGTSRCVATAPVRGPGCWAIGDACSIGGSRRRVASGRMVWRPRCWDRRSHNPSETVPDPCEVGPTSRSEIPGARAPLGSLGPLKERVGCRTASGSPRGQCGPRSVVRFGPRARSALPRPRRSRAPLRSRRRGDGGLRPDAPTA